MYLKLIDFDTSEYRDLIDLRYRILRKPLGLTFSEDDLRKEERDLFIACYDEQNNKLIAGCVLTHNTPSCIKMRQMAVDSEYQHKGIGAKVLNFAEEVAANKGYKSICLHARKEALLFYKKNGYSIESDEFIEVGIPHYEMLKTIE